MNLELIETLLQDGGFEEPIYLYAMPDDVSVGALLKTPLEGIPLDNNLPNYYKGRLQVIVRANEHRQGEALAKQVVHILHSHLKKSLPVGGPEEMQLNYCLLDKLPIRFPRSDDGAGIEWSINFDCCYVMAF